jgi:CRP-like cAMP-binding protein
VLPVPYRSGCVVSLGNHTICRNRLLAAVSQKDFDRFFARLQPVSLALRQVLYEVGGPLEHVYFIEQGVASVLTVMNNGSMIEVGMIGCEGIVGMAALFGAPFSAQHIVVQIPGTALRMTAVHCKEAFQRCEAVRAVILRFTENMLNLSAQTAACNRLHSIEQRCARWILMASDRLQPDIIPMTHEFMATMLGVNRPGVTLVAGEFQRSGLIKYHHGHITIIDRYGLEAAACECWLIDHEQLQRGFQSPGSAESTERQRKEG